MHKYRRQHVGILCVLVLAMLFRISCACLLCTLDMMLQARVYFVMVLYSRMCALQYAGAAVYISLLQCVHVSEWCVCMHL